LALEPLSLRGYAAHRRSLGLTGGTLPAVRKAIARERLVESVVTVAGVKKIADPELADREWAANTDPSKLPIGFLEDDEDGEQQESPMVLAAAREKHWKAERAELEFRKLAGELVDAAEVRAQFVDLCTTARNKLLGLPNRMKQAHPDLTLQHLATLDQYVRESLEELPEEAPAADIDDAEAAS
jgi:hypothetical protein